MSVATSRMQVIKKRYMCEVEHFIYCPNYIIIVYIIYQFSELCERLFIKFHKRLHIKVTENIDDRLVDFDYNNGACRSSSA